MITIRVSEAFQRAVQVAADAEDRTVTWYIIQAVNEKMYGASRKRINPNTEKRFEHFGK